MVEEIVVPVFPEMKYPVVKYPSTVVLESLCVNMLGFFLCYLYVQEYKKK